MTTASGTGGRPPGTLTTAPDQVVTALESLRIPGGVVAVSVGGRGSAVEPFGTVAPGGAAVTARTHFMIGSVTKTFTATAVLRLVDQGKLRLSDPIARYVSGVPDGRAITIRELLNHTSGVPDYAASAAFQRQANADPDQRWKPQELVHFAAGLPAYFPPGRGWRYSDTNYILLGLVLQAVTGQPAAQVIRSQVLRPLGLHDTGLATTLRLPGPAARPNQVHLDAQGTDPQPAPPDALNPSAYWTAGGMYSTVGDLLVWARALATGSLLQAKTQRARLAFVDTGEDILALQQLGGANGFPLTYGLGIYDLGGILGHDGEINGWNAAIGYLPAAHATFVVLLDAEVVAGSGQTAAPVPVTDGAMAALAQLTVPTFLHPGPATGTPGQPAR